MNRLLYLLPIVALSACSLGPVATDPQFQYAQANVYKNLEIPPDLTIEHDNTFSIPGIDELNSAAPDYEDAKLVRTDNAIWLEITGDTNLVWTRLHDFLNLQGIKIETSDPLTGLITSEWLSNQTGVSAGNLLDNLKASFISENYLDQYVISVERNENDKVKVVIIHNGLTKVVHDADSKSTSISEQWVKSPTNTALSLTLLKRFMAYSGLSSKLGVSNFSQQELDDLFKFKVIKKNKKDHYIVVKRPAKRVFSTLKNTLFKHYDVEKIREQSAYILINEPYKYVRLEKKSAETKKQENTNLIRIQIVNAGYSTKIIIRNDRGEAIDLATTDRLLNKIMSINL